jgi:hypothetical protein
MRDAYSIHHTALPLLALLKWFSNGGLASGDNIAF